MQGNSFCMLSFRGGKQNSGFGDKHSGQFNVNIQSLKPLYDELLRQFIITPNP